jgi:hypothetical protein
VCLKNISDCIRSHNDSIDTTQTPPPLSFYNTFKETKTEVLYATTCFFRWTIFFEYNSLKWVTAIV